MHKYLKITIFTVIALFVQLNFYAQGCAQCRHRLENSKGGEIAVGNGINIGIIILMTVPYIIIFFMFRKKIVGFLKEFLLMWK